MKPILVLLFASFLAFPIALLAEEKTSVAQVDYSLIDDLLKQVVLSAPENKELRQRYQILKAEYEAMMDKFQDAMMKGEKIDPHAASRGMMHNSVEEKKLNVLCEKHILGLLEEMFEKQYDLVLKESYGSALLYTQIPIDDVTPLVKQALLKQLPKSE